MLVKLLGDHTHRELIATRHVLGDHGVRLVLLATVRDFVRAEGVKLLPGNVVEDALVVGDEVRPRELLLSQSSLALWAVLGPVTSLPEKRWRWDRMSRFSQELRAALRGWSLPVSLPLSLLVRAVYHLDMLEATVGDDLLVAAGFANVAAHDSEYAGAEDVATAGVRALEPSANTDADDYLSVRLIRHHPVEYRCYVDNTGQEADYVEGCACHCACFKEYISVSGYKCICSKDIGNV